MWSLTYDKINVKNITKRHSSELTSLCGTIKLPNDDHCQFVAPDKDKRKKTGSPCLSNDNQLLSIVEKTTQLKSVTYTELYSLSTEHGRKDDSVGKGSHTPSL